MNVVVVATIRAQPEHHAAVLAAFRDAVPAVHVEDGCLLYALHERDDRLVVVEQWESQEALDAHSGGPAIEALGARISDLLAEAPDVVVLTPVPAGDEDRGRVRPEGA